MDLPRNVTGRILWPRVRGHAAWLKKVAPEKTNAELVVEFKKRYGVLLNRNSIAGQRRTYKAPLSREALARVYKTRRGNQQAAPVDKPAAKKPEGARTKTLSQFRSVFDVKERIRNGITTHLHFTGPVDKNGVYMLDQDFREACGIQIQDWRRFADLDEFEPYRWRHKGLLHWAQPRMLASMRETVGVV